MTDNGFYRAVVTNNADPLGRRRVKFRAPFLLGSLESEWADPVLAKQDPPALGTSIVISFPDGDVSRPAWLLPMLSVAEQGDTFSGVWNGTPIAVAYGGTGGTTTAQAKTNLGFITKVWNDSFSYNAGSTYTFTHGINSVRVMMAFYDNTTGGERVFGMTEKILSATQITFKPDVTYTDMKIMVFG